MQFDRKSAPIVIRSLIDDNVNFTKIVVTDLIQKTYDLTYENDKKQVC